MCRPPISLWSPNSTRRQCFCVQVERVLCASAFLCITQPARKNKIKYKTRGVVDMREGELTLENCIPFCFSSAFALSKRHFFSVKRLCFSTPFQWADTPTVKCWKWQQQQEKKSKRAWYCGARELCKYNRKERSSLTTPPCFDSSLTSPYRRWRLCKWANMLCLLYTDSVCIGSHSDVLFCS